jgi:hypothetical protein
MSAAAAKVKKFDKPTAAQVDTRAKAYNKLTAAIEAKESELDAQKDDLVEMCRQHGITPPGAEKTFRLAGAVYDVDASFGISTSYDQDAIAEIVDRLDSNPHLVRPLFDLKLTYTPRPDAASAIAKLPARTRKWLEPMFAAVVKTSPKKPSLKVNERNAKKAKQPQKARA